MDMTQKQKAAIKQLAWGRIEYGKRCAIHKRILDQLAARGMIEIGQDKYLRSHVYLTHDGKKAAMEIDPAYKAFQEET